MEQETKETILRIQGAQMHLYENYYEGITLDLSINSGCIHIWAHNRSNGKNKIHCKGFVSYHPDYDEWFTIGSSIRKYNTSVMLSKLSKFIGIDI